MKYMLLFWVDEAAESTADEDVAMLTAVKSWVEKLTEQGVRLGGGPLRSVAEGRIVRVVCRGEAFAAGAAAPFAVMQATMMALYDRPGLAG